MIIDTSGAIKENDVVAFKLTSGEEVVAKVLAITDAEFTISKPMAMTVVPGRDGSATVAFMPWTLGMPDDAKIKFLRDKIIAYAKARKEAADGYLRNTSSIQPASNIPGLHV